MVKMIDITQKEVTFRIAEAEGKIHLKHSTIQRIKEKAVKKGNVLTTSKITGIEAVKEVPSLLPLCHPIPLSGIDIDIDIKEESVVVKSKVKSLGKTGCEMEALTGVVLSLLNIWDMVKTYEKDQDGQYPWTKIEGVKVTNKIKQKID